MTMFTRNCPKNNNLGPRNILCLAVFFSLLYSPVFAASGSVVDAGNATGGWNKGIITAREAVFTDRALARSEVKAYVFEPGKYQLFAYIHHNWRRSVPRILVEVVDNNGFLYQGFHRIENIWYLDQDSPGRWFMASLTTEPYWGLPRGDLTIRFWAESQEGVWDTAKAAMEGDVAIDKFFLIPVQGSGKDLSLSGVIYPESGTGDWDISEYQAAYATNLAESAKQGQTLVVAVKVPYPGYYKLWAEAFSESDNGLKIIFRGDQDEQEMNIKIKGAASWSMIRADPVYLKQGEYKLILEHLSPDKVALDYLMLLPGGDPQK
ncbi:MAG: hypothetical protein PHH68_07690 [Candidatus Omnitrophica bacterium]|nr:hypothetical protein [Candidatus Omnitrophota bacterium]